MNIKILGIDLTTEAIVLIIIAIYFYIQFLFAIIGCDGSLKNFVILFLLAIPILLIKPLNNWWFKISV